MKTLLNVRDRAKVLDRLANLRRDSQRQMGKHTLSLGVEHMLKSEIKPRTEYALREKRVPAALFQPTRIIEHISREQVES
jgi:hypothetical protein